MSEGAEVDDELQAVFDDIVKEDPSQAKSHFIGKKKKQVPQPENLYDDFYEASNRVDQVLIGLYEHDIETVKLIRSTPGIGKTEAAIHRLSMKAKNGTMPFMAVATRDMAWQVYERLKGGFYGMGHRVIMLEGRHDGYVRTRLNENGTLDEIQVQANCYHYDEVCKAREKGYHAQYAVCSKCPFWPHYKDKNGNKTGVGGSCEYYKDMFRAAGIVPFGAGDWKPIVIMTHHMMANVVSESEIIKAEDLTIDEDFLTAMREIYEWHEFELERMIDQDELYVFRKLLRKAIDVGKQFHMLGNYPAWHQTVKGLSAEDQQLRKLLYEARNFGSVTLWGKGLAAVLKRAAVEMGQDLADVVEAAAVAQTGLERGEYMDMPPWREERLPHQKDPELAQAIKEILAQAQDDTETAYKVSLRMSPDQPWAFVWDHVRRMGYGGQLILLDAYGDKLLYERLCQREVEVIEVKCKIRQNVTVHHFPIRSSRKIMDDDESRRALFFEYVVPQLRKQRGKKVLLYTQKRYAEWLESMIEAGKFGLQSYVIKWFWQDRGDDNYGDFDALIDFGTPYSNVVADTHFCNALYAGEEPLDFTGSPTSGYKDERVERLKHARQENELLQAIFRLRPAKPRDDPQDIVILSQMKLPIELEMPGAIKKMEYEPDFDAQGVAAGMFKLWKYFGCWTDSLAAFLYDADALIAWFEAGGIDSDLELPFTYDEIRYRVRRFLKNNAYLKARDTLLGVTLKAPCFDFIYNNGVAVKPVRLWGDRMSAIRVLNALRAATREPGIDEEIESPDDAETEVPASNENLQQKAVGAEDLEDAESEANADVAKLLSIMKSAGKGGGGPPDQSGGSGTGPPNTS